MPYPTKEEDAFHTAHASANFDELHKSTTAGCFYCKKIFDPKEIVEWAPDTRGKTAICPYCHIDSVYGDASEREVNEKNLNDMKNLWFNDEA